MSEEVSNTKPADSRKSYLYVMDYVKEKVKTGLLHPGDRLPTERQLCEELQISRGSLREGLRVLESLGVIYSLQGSGNFIANNFDASLLNILGFMYFLYSSDPESIMEFRWSIERAVLPLAVSRITEEEKRELLLILDRLERANTEEDRLDADRELHMSIVKASKNRMMIANYQALLTFIDSYISGVRARVIEGMRSRRMLEKAHRMYAQGITDGDLFMAEQGLETHISYTNLYAASAPSYQPLPDGGK